MYCLSGWGDWGATYVAGTQLNLNGNQYTHCPIILCGLAKEAVVIFNWSVDINYQDTGVSFQSYKGHKTSKWRLLDRFNLN